MCRVRRLAVIGLALGLLLSMVALAGAQGVTPSVTVNDQPIVDGKVTIAEVVSDGPGWLVIHAQKDGKPGPVIGHSPVAAGVNSDVVVEIDVANATETLYAMLHTDAGEIGTYEFPGPDAPVAVDGKVVTPAFQVTGGLAMAMETVTPEITVVDQEVTDGTVVIPVAIAAEPGWVVIHIDGGGKPGPVIGWAPVQAGENRDVKVSIDVQKATETLFAMLHVDRGAMGTYEFPGADVPVKVNDRVVVKPFKAMMMLPTTLPETGGVLVPWLAALLVALGGLVLAGGVGLILVRRARQIG